VRVLVDTNALIWFLVDDQELSAAARDAIRTSDEVFVSAVSLWEIAIKSARGRLDVPDDLEARLSALGFLELPVAWRHARISGQLEPHHGDPFDRMLVAQALVDDLTVVTRDREIPRYGVRVIQA
jgi:PIN domain nuclease of toxin-antitoxin system